MIVFSTTVTFGEIVVVVKDFDTGVILDEVVIDVGVDEACVEDGATEEEVAADVDAGVVTAAVDDVPNAYRVKLATPEEPNFDLDKDAALILFFKLINLLLNGETTKFSKFL